MRREGQSVRLTLQLIDARNDVHLWSKNFDRQLTDAITLQSAVAEEVGSQLVVKLSGDIGDLPQPADPEAYDLYLKARLGMQTVTGMRSPREQQKALALLDRALALDEHVCRGISAARAGAHEHVYQQPGCQRDEPRCAACRSRRRPSVDGRCSAPARERSELRDVWSNSTRRKRCACCAPRSRSIRAPRKSALAWRAPCLTPKHWPRRWRTMNARRRSTPAIR